MLFRYHATSRWIATSAAALLCAFSTAAVSQDSALTENQGIDDAAEVAVEPLRAPPVAESPASESPDAPAAPTLPTLVPATPPAALITLEPPIEVREIRESVGLPSAPLDLTARTANLWDRIRAGFSMQDLATPLVAERQAWYAARPAQIRIMAERSRRYLFHIVEELEKRGLPTELALLPMVESAFNPMAYSRAQASGLWQFIPSTGRSYNLSQNWWYDGRRDIVASTTAALEYLQNIYTMHGDWHLALASYNWGEYAVARAVERNRRMDLPTDYASLPMPEETRHYVPKLQALKNIILNPQAHGIELEPIPNAPYFATVTLTRDIDLKVAARFAEMPIDEMIALNPAHNRPVVSSARAPTLVLPADRLDRFLANLASTDRPLSNWRTITAQRGDRIDRIAAAHGVPVDLLRLANGIRGNGRLPAETPLLIPVAGTKVEVPSGLFPHAGIVTTPERTERAAKGRGGKTLAAVGKVATPTKIAATAKRSGSAAHAKGAARKGPIQVARR